VALHGFLDQSRRCGSVSILRDEGFQDLALMMDGAPEAAHLAVDFDVGLV
jgi:hypothetical protein